MDYIRAGSSETGAAGNVECGEDAARRGRMAAWRPRLPSARVETRPSKTLRKKHLPGIFDYCNHDRESHIRITAVVKVVPIVIIDVKVVGVIPVVGPVFRPWIHQQERKALVLKARIPHVHNRERAHHEEVLAAEIEIEASLRQISAAVAATLLPGAMVGGPVLGATLLPCGVCLPAAALSRPTTLLLV